MCVEICYSGALLVLGAGLTIKAENHWRDGRPQVAVQRYFSSYCCYCCFSCSPEGYSRAGHCARLVNRTVFCDLRQWRRCDQLLSGLAGQISAYFALELSSRGLSLRSTWLDFYWLGSRRYCNYLAGDFVGDTIHGLAWNLARRRAPQPCQISRFHRWEFVKLVQYFCGVLKFKHYFDIHCRRFFCQVSAGNVYSISEYFFSWPGNVKSMLCAYEFRVFIVPLINFLCFYLQYAAKALCFPSVRLPAVRPSVICCFSFNAYFACCDISLLRGGISHIHRVSGFLR